MYQILITPFIAALAAQLIKLTIKSNNLKLNWRSLISYSGMPSSHAAMAASLATSVGLTEGVNSPIFAACVVFSFFIIRDALGIRQYVGQHGAVLNDLIKNLRQDKIGPEKEYPVLIEKIGHTPAQIIAGILLGFLISWFSFICLA